MKKINLILIVMLVVTMFAPAINVWAEETITIETPSETQIQTETELEVQPETSITVNTETTPTTETQISATPAVPMPASALTFQTDKTSYTVGDTVTAKVKVDTFGADINSITAQIGYPSDILEIESVSAGDVVTLWVQQPQYSTDTIDLSGSIPDGYNGTDGRILTITFKIKKSGTPEIKFNSLSVQGTNILNINTMNQLSSSTFNITSGTTVTLTGPQIRFTSVLSDTQHNVGFSLDTGILSTNDNQPTFVGIAKPNTKVQIYEKFDHSVIKDEVETFTPVYGSTTSDQDGNWEIKAPFNTTSGTLLNADYVFLACEVENDMCIQYTEDFHLIVDSNLDVQNIYLQEIKVYDRDAKIESQPLGEISMIVYGNGYDGKPATMEDGYHVQANIFVNGTTDNYITPNPEGSYNGTYDNESGGWKVNMKVPSVAGDYYLKTILYCSKQDSPCWQMEHNGATHTEPNIITPFTVGHEPVVRSISEDTGRSDTDFITKDNTPSFYGTSNPNATIDVYSWSMAPCPVVTPGTACTYAALLIGRTISNQDGYWSLENSNSIHPDGQYQIFAHATIGTDTYIGPSAVMTIDTTIPDVPIITSPISQEFEYTNSIEVSGTCSEEGAQIYLTLEDVALYKGDEYPKLGNYLGYGTLCIDGKFTTKISNDLEPFAPVNLLSKIRFAAVQIDSSENMSEMSNIIVLTHKFPVINSISNETKLDNEFHVVNNKNPKLYGTARPNATIQLFEAADHLAMIDGAERYTAIYARTTSDDKGNFIFEAPFTTIGGALELGEYHFLVCDITYDICEAGTAKENNFAVRIVEPSTGGGGGGGGGNPPPKKCIVFADINCDDKVNKYDFALMMKVWELKIFDKADLNTDISIDKYDFALLMSNWGYGEDKFN